VPGRAPNDASWLNSGAVCRPTRPETRDLHLARAAVLVTLLSYTALQASSLMAFPRTPRGLGLAGDIAAMLALLAVTIWVTAADTRRWPASRRWLVLLAQMLLTYMPVGISGSLFSGCAACLAGSALLLLPLWAGAALFAAVIASMLLTAQALVASAYETAVCLLTTLVFGLVVFVLPRLAWFIGSAREGWRDAATFAVIN